MKEIKSNGLEDIISQAIEEMKTEQGNRFSLEKINLAELERRTGISRAKLQIAIPPGRRGRNTRPVRAIIGGRQVA